LQPEDEVATPAKRLTKRQAHAAEILEELNRKLRRIGPADIDQFRNALKRSGWGPENPGSWRRAFFELKARLEIDSKGSVLRLR
jgi:hypothetical protein